MYFFHWFRFSAGWALLISLAYQVLGSLDEIQGLGHVAFSAHLGGGFAGLLLWKYWSKSPRLRRIN